MLAKEFSLDRLPVSVRLALKVNPNELTSDQREYYRKAMIEWSKRKFAEKQR